MKLTELAPRWWVLENGGPIVGLSFDCPHCRVERLGVVFHHLGHEAIEDAYIRARNSDAKPIWTMTGENFDTLTLSPSVDASHVGHWHGFVTNGEVT